jgi:hypothetical protein
MRNPIYLGRPDAFFTPDSTDPVSIGGSDGGGDIDIAVSFPTHPDSIPVVTIMSLAAATISTARSHDRGTTWALSPASSITPVDDRQWVEARRAGESPEAIAAKQAEMAKLAEMYRNPLINSAMTFMEPLPVALVVALVTAGVLGRRKKAEQAPATA